MSLLLYNNGLADLSVYNLEDFQAATILFWTIPNKYSSAWATDTDKRACIDSSNENIEWNIMTYMYLYWYWLTKAFVVVTDGDTVKYWAGLYNTHVT